MINYEHFSFNVEGRNVVFNVRGWSGPKHWGHVGTVTVDGAILGGARIEYLNRTWECYRFQSLLYKLASKYFEGSQKAALFDMIKNR